jgi:hypothetical protein
MRACAFSAPGPSTERERRTRRGGESEAEAPIPSTEVSSPRPGENRSNPYKVLSFFSFFDLGFFLH